MNKSEDAMDESPKRFQMSMQPEPVVCDICSRPYKNRATLYSHKNRDHGVRGQVPASK